MIGGAPFTVWQTQLGDASFRGAIIHSMTSALVLLALAVRDD